MQTSPLSSLSLACQSATHFSLLPSLSSLSQFVPRRNVASLSPLSASLKSSPSIISMGPLPWTDARFRVLSCMSRWFSHVDNTKLIVPRALNMADGQSDKPEKLYLGKSMELVHQVWEIIPQHIKNFPWMKALESFIQIILELVYAVAKYLCVPLLAVSSLSEMSYCAQERKMILIPILLLAGFSVAGVLRDTAMELSADLKKEEYPWHLLVIAIFFTLLKLPGPSYPYWARIVLPHFANGALWRTIWFAILWYRKPREPSRSILETSVDDMHCEKKP